MVIWSNLTKLILNEMVSVVDRVISCGGIFLRVLCVVRGFHAKAQRTQRYSHIREEYLCTRLYRHGYQGDEAITARSAF